MFDFRNATNAQRAAITNADGPLLIAGGPGTGKTWVLVRRAAYMVAERGIAPQSILLIAQTPRAARDLRADLEEVFDSYGIGWASARVEIATCPDYCAQILSSSPRTQDPLAGSRLLDLHAQQFVLYLQYPLLCREIPGLARLEDTVPSWQIEGHEPRWVYAGVLRDWINRLTQALVDPEELSTSSDPQDKMCASLLTRYAALQQREFFTDTAAVQVRALRMLQNSPPALARTRALVQHVLVDDYQNASCAQAQVLSLIAGPEGSICVCADEDQALQRAGGGRTQNVFGFSTLVPEAPHRTILLDINFRSNEDIIRFDDAWMRSLGDAADGMTWGQFRKPRVTVGTGRSLRSPGAVQLTAKTEDDWHQQVLALLSAFRKGGSERDLRQVVLTAQNIRADAVCGLAACLEKNRVPVFSPYLPSFFSRPEVRTAIGALWLAYGEGAEDLRLSDEVRDYYAACADNASAAADGTLGEWIAQNADRSLLSILAGVFLQPPFDAWMDRTEGGASAQVTALSLVAGALESCMRLPPLAGHANRDRLFFEHWLPVLLRNGLPDSGYAYPAGNLRVQPIPSLAGIGVPLILTAVPARLEEDASGELPDAIERRYSPDPPAEPADKLAWFDLFRTYYTAFSRAEDLLILTCGAPPESGSIMDFGPVRDLPCADGQQFCLDEFCFRLVTDDAPAETAVKLPPPPAPRADAAAKASASSAEHKKSAPPSAEARRFRRSLFVSAMGVNHVNNEAANNKDGDDKADDQRDEADAVPEGPSGSRVHIDTDDNAGHNNADGQKNDTE